ncbi:DUF4390 domain-containing protein [Spiribacter onubensis]|uniref:DUF4390 domain-containing protein n=1 Tax=Spiribacter onubensis TaxID=3122420 RepID=A0ABV3SC84_9GAMM
MPAWKNAERTAIGLTLLLTAMAAFAQTGGFRISELDIRVADQLVLADARIDYALSATATEALENGVALVIAQRLRLQTARWWWGDAVVVSQQRRYRLQYHAISRRYVLTRLESGESRSYRSLDALLLRLGRVEAWPVVRLDRLDTDTDYRLRLDTGLEVDELPRLLRMVAWINPEWQLRSEPRYRALSP